VDCVVICLQKECGLNKLPRLQPQSINFASYLDWKAAAIVVSGLLLKLLLASLPVGWQRAGSISTDGTRIHYRCNGNEDSQQWHRQTHKLALDNNQSS